MARKPKKLSPQVPMLRQVKRFEQIVDALDKLQSKVESFAEEVDGWEETWQIQAGDFVLRLQSDIESAKRPDFWEGPDASFVHGEDKDGNLILCSEDFRGGFIAGMQEILDNMHLFNDLTDTSEKEKIEAWRRFLREE